MEKSVSEVSVEQLAYLARLGSAGLAADAEAVLREVSSRSDWQRCPEPQPIIKPLSF